MQTQGEKKLVGKITHYFTKIGVCVIELSDELKVGDKISVEGPTSNYAQKVESMQIEHANVQNAGPGQAVGMKSEQRCRQGDLVYKVG